MKKKLHLRFTALGPSSICLYSIDLLAFLLLLGYGLLAPVPITEGWFIELTRNKSVGELLRGSDILIPPLYPLATKMVMVFTDHLLAFRLVGVTVGMALYLTTKKCANIFLVLMNSEDSKRHCGPSLIALYMLVFCYGYSLYTIFYDFTMIVLLIQVMIVSLLSMMIEGHSRDMCMAVGRSHGPLMANSVRLAWLAGLLATTGILLKQSNMGLFAIAICLYMLTISVQKKYRAATLEFTKGAVTGLLLVLAWIMHGSIGVQEGERVTDILLSSLYAKGGSTQIQGFVGSFFQTWSNIHTEPATIVLSAAVVLLLCLSCKSRPQSFCKTVYANRIARLTGLTTSTISILWTWQISDHGGIAHWALQMASAASNALITLVILIVASSLVAWMRGVCSFDLQKRSVHVLRPDKQLLSLASIQVNGFFRLILLLERVFSFHEVHGLYRSPALPLLSLWLFAGIGSAFGNVTSAGLGFNGLYVLLTLGLMLLLLASRGIEWNDQIRLSRLAGAVTAAIIVALIGTKSVREFSIIHDGYLFRWWDVAEVRYGDKLCSPRKIYEGVWPLRVTCSDMTLGEGLQKEILRSSYNQKSIPIVLPAQTLLYRLKGLGSERVENATIVWNDFMAGDKSRATFFKIANPRRSVTSTDSQKSYIFIATRTSPETLRGSGLNFGKAIGSNVYYQKQIEDYIYGLAADRRFDSTLIKRHNQSHRDVLLLIEKLDSATSADF